MRKASFLFLLLFITILYGCNFDRINDLENECESLRERNEDLSEEVNNLNETISELQALTEHLMNQINKDNIALGEIKSQQLFLDFSIDYIAQSFLFGKMDYDTFSVLSNRMLSPHIDAIEKLIKERDINCSYPIIVDWSRNGNDVRVQVKTPIYGPYGLVLTPMQ